MIDGTNDGGTGVRGVIRPVTDLSGAILPPPLLSGVVDTSFLMQDVFAVDFLLDADSSPVDAFGLTVGTALFFLNPQGAGAFDDAGPGVVAPTAVDADSSVAFQGLFTFGTPVQGGEASVRLFVTHDLGDIAGTETVSFMVSSGTDFTVQGRVPEPGTALLLAAGLAALAASRGRGARGR